MPEIARIRGQSWALAALFAAAFSTSMSYATEAPLWEFGLGAGAIAFQDYRGSDTTHAYPLPVPYIVYNGKFLKADRDGVRGTLFNQDWLEINLSFNLTTPVRNDRERSGMPDLQSTVEVGPSFDFHLFRTGDRKVKLDLRMPLRAAATVESSPRIIGWTFSPRLNLDLKDPLDYPAGILDCWPGHCSLIAAIMITSIPSHRSMRLRRARNLQPPGATPARRLWRPSRSAIRSFGWAPICATTRWPARLLLTAPWFSAKAIGRADLASLG
jgi:hypothetical protein